MDCQGAGSELPSSFASRGSGHQEHYPYLDSSNHDFVRNLADNCFSKTFRLKTEDEHWKLPDKKSEDLPGHGKWQISELGLLKERLNVTKSKLNTFNLAEWHKHTNFMNPAGLVLIYLRSFCIELLTQAWCKFFELLNVFKVIPEILEGTVNTVHLCEAPGAFIAAMNHYLQLNRPNIKWHWIANTLNPYYEGNGLDEMINDDRFIFKTLDNWWFGEDYTGNIRSQKNIDSLEQIVSRLGPIHIITADGSVDCLKNPAEQEAQVLALHYAEAFAGLKILSKGGTFIIKIFTIFEYETVCLLYLLCCAFKTVSVHKPVVSKEGNSEVYVVCCGYFGKEKCREVVEEINTFNQYGRVIINKDALPVRFIEKITACSSFFTNLQIDVLEKNIKSYKNNMSYKKKMLVKRLKNSVAELFIERFNIASLSDQSYYIIKDKSLEKKFNHVPKNEEGTFEERQELLHIDKTSRLLRSKEELLSYKELWNRPQICWFKLDKMNSTFFNPIIGKKIFQIKSSNFCRGNLIKIINDIECFGSLISSTKEEIYSRLVEYAPDSSTDYIFCHVPSECFMSNFYEYQKISLKTIVTELKKVSAQNNFVLSGLCLLTQFSVGLAYIIGLAFTEVGIVCPEEVGYVMIYKNLINNSIFLKLNELLDKYFSCDIAVLSVLPLRLLCDGNWNRCITTVNHLALKKMALKHISNQLNQN